jgi:four helix bundle protein
MRDFKKYDVWQLSHEFCVRVYSVTKNYPKDEIYGMTSQIRRASLSIPTNISEGAGRYGDKEFANFLNIALGSAHEVENLLIISNDLDYLTGDLFIELADRVNTIKRKLYHFHRKIKTN